MEWRAAPSAQALHPYLAPARCGGCRQRPWQRMQLPWSGAGPASTERVRGGALIQGWNCYKHATSRWVASRKAWAGARLRQGRPPPRPWRTQGGGSRASSWRPATSSPLQALRTSPASSAGPPRQLWRGTTAGARRATPCLQASWEGSSSSSSGERHTPARRVHMPAAAGARLRHPGAPGRLRAVGPAQAGQQHLQLWERQRPSLWSRPAGRPGRQAAVPRPSPQQAPAHQVPLAPPARWAA